MDVIICKGSKIYHEDYCPYLRRSKQKLRMSEDSAINKGYCGCKFCTGIKGLAFKYRKYSNGDYSIFAITEPEDTLCFRTNCGFWKAIWRDKRLWILFHMNNHGYKCFNAKYPNKMLVNGRFHRQQDVQPSESLKPIIKYIKDHDKNLKVMEEDYRKLPKNTKEQRKNYKKAKKRKRKLEIQRVEKLFRQMEKERRL